MNRAQGDGNAISAKSYIHNVDSTWSTVLMLVKCLIRRWKCNQHNIQTVNGVDDCNVSPSRRPRCRSWRWYKTSQLPTRYHRAWVHNLGFLCVLRKVKKSYFCCFSFSAFFSSSMSLIVFPVSSSSLSWEEKDYLCFRNFRSSWIFPIFPSLYWKGKVFAIELIWFIFF